MFQTITNHLKAKTIAREDIAGRRISYKLMAQPRLNFIVFSDESPPGLTANTAKKAFQEGLVVYRITISRPGRPKHLWTQSWAHRRIDWLIPFPTHIHAKSSDWSPSAGKVKGKSEIGER